MSKTDGGPAFPQTSTDYERGIPSVHVTGGMTLRQWYIGQALAGLCANPGGPFQANSMSGWGIVNCTEDDVASVAERLADAVLAREAK
jgi:hypothetical protein